MTEKQLIEKFDLRSQLRFQPDDGQIWLGENRMLMLHAKAVGSMRKDLFDLLGSRAKGVLLRWGFAAGQADADVTLKLFGENDNFDVFNIGPVLHGFEGIVRSKITDCKIDWQEGCFEGEVDLMGSWEAEAHRQQFGVMDDVACWTIAGYASGYVTHFFKRFIVFKEVSCACSGADKCKIVAKPAEEWGDEEYIRYFRPDSIDDEQLAVEAELESLRGTRRRELNYGRLVGNSPAFLRAFELLNQAANSPINVLLLGETGVGKEMFARWLHDNSDRSDKPFIAINCAAIPHDLIESELFGVVRGAFTGADSSRPGRFERADGGTLLLDEVGDLPAAVQVKLLRVLQSGEVERLGDDKCTKVDVRLIAATNIDLKAAINKGNFRADLYFRLATYPVEIPPLRERRSDIPLLAEALVEKYEPLYSKSISGITERALNALMIHQWAGNVRELENVIERGVLLAPNNGFIELEHLFSQETTGVAIGSAINRDGQVRSESEEARKQILDALLDEEFSLQEHEWHLLDRAVTRTNGNLTHAAKLLGISRRQLAYRLKSHEPRVDNKSTGT